jgi:RNA polymerase subunit RPABC4/transcription elongation factor Spt4
MNCFRCGTEITPEIKFCPKCGAQNTGRRILHPSCPRCRQEFPEGTKFCPQDGLELRDKDEIAYADLPLTYQIAFKKFDQKGFRLTWSWIGFFFGGIWYLVKGMWAKGLIILGLTIITGFHAFPFTWLYCIFLGKYDYYLLRVKDKQLW